MLKGELGCTQPRLFRGALIDFPGNSGAGLDLGYSVSTRGLPSAKGVLVTVKLAQLHPNTSPPAPANNSRFTVESFFVGCRVIDGGGESRFLLADRPRGQVFEFAGRPVLVTPTWGNEVSVNNKVILR